MTDHDHSSAESHSDESHAHDDHSHGESHDHGHSHGESHDHDSHDHDDHAHAHHAHDVNSVSAAILTVSTSRTLDDDPAGDAIAAAFESADHAVAARDVVADDFDSLRSTVDLPLIYISEPTRRRGTSYAVLGLKKKKTIM